MTDEGQADQVPPSSKRAVSDNDRIVNGGSGSEVDSGMEIALPVQHNSNRQDTTEINR